MGKGIVENDFAECLKLKKIMRFTAAKQLVDREMRSAVEDLKAARHSLKRNEDKWATVQAYYAMFHTARALLYSRGYREKSHYCLIVAMKVFFVKENLLDLRLIEAFQTAKSLHENADYDNEYSKASARSLTDHAENFLLSAEKIFNIVN